MNDYLRYIILLAVLVIIQKTLIWVFAVTAYDITPDIVIIGLAYFGIQKGKIAGSIAGFAAGLVIDFFSFSFLGLMALSKASAGFLAGFFNAENKIERNTRSFSFVIIVFVCSLLNNVLYFILYYQGTTLGFYEILLRYIIPTALYTAIVSILPLAFTRNKILVR